MFEKSDSNSRSRFFILLKAVHIILAALCLTYTPHPFETI